MNKFSCNTMPLNTFYRINRFFFSSNMSCQRWWFSIHGVCLVHCFTSAFRQRNSIGDLIKTNSQKVLVRASYLTCETWNFDIENNWAQCLYTSDDVECYYCNKLKETLYTFIFVLWERYITNATEMRVLIWSYYTVGASIF